MNYETESYEYFRRQVAELEPRDRDFLRLQLNPFILDGFIEYNVVLDYESENVKIILLSDRVVIHNSFFIGEELQTYVDIFINTSEGVRSVLILPDGKVGHVA